MRKKKDSRIRNQPKTRWGILVPPISKTIISQQVLEKWVDSVDYFLCVDGALNALGVTAIKSNIKKRKLVAWIGDGDSLKSARVLSRFQQIIQIKLKKEKDTTDLGEACYWISNWCKSKNIEVADVRVLGAWGGRFDHHLVALDELRKMQRRLKVPLIWQSGCSEEWGLLLSFKSEQSFVELPFESKCTFSIFGDAHVYSIEGAKYSQLGYRPGMTAQTLSNFSKAKMLKVKARDGQLLFVFLQQFSLYKEQIWKKGMNNVSD